MPAALGVELGSEELAWVHFALHAGGASALVAAMAAWRMEMVAAAALPVGLGALLLAGNVWWTVARARLFRDPVAMAFALAAGWLVATVLAGGLLALNQRWFFLPLSPFALLRAHAHLGIAGFFLTLIQGATFRLVPMFTLATVRSWRRVQAGLLTTQLGLIVLVPALAWEKHILMGIGATLLFAGVALSGWELCVTLASRQKRAIGPGLQGFGADFRERLDASSEIVWDCKSACRRQ
jgi:hypothetical protein